VRASSAITMVASTMVAVFFVPLFFWMLESMGKKKP